MMMMRQPPHEEQFPLKSGLWVLGGRWMVKMMEDCSMKKEQWVWRRPWVIRQVRWALVLVR